MEAVRSDLVPPATKWADGVSIRQRHLKAPLAAVLAVAEPSRRSWARQLAWGSRARWWSRASSTMPGGCHRRDQRLIAHAAALDEEITRIRFSIGGRHHLLFPIIPPAMRMTERALP